MLWATPLNLVLSLRDRQFATGVKCHPNAGTQIYGKEAAAVSTMAPPAEVAKQTMYYRASAPRSNLPSIWRQARRAPAPYAAPTRGYYPKGARS